MGDSVHPLPYAQQHLEWDAHHEQYVDREGAEKDRVDAHAKEVPPPGQRGYPDVYVNGDVTLTVDPVKTQHWIRDDSHAWRHAATAHRGDVKLHKGVIGSMQGLVQQQYAPETFIPTSRHLDESLKLTPRCVQNSTRGKVGTRGNPGNPALKGQLPIYSQLIWQNKLPETTDWRVWRDVWMENTHLSRNRAFDCDGMCR